MKPDKGIEDLSRMINPVIRGWINYYGRFYKSELYTVFQHLNKALIRWVRISTRTVEPEPELDNGWTS